MNTINEIPVLLVTGYLGSGKTTLLNNILANRKGIKFAVIVNDIGEVNIDAELIQKGGVVSQADDSLVALQNGCICCNLKMDLVQQLADIAATKQFDYIVIEASGICEPGPIAQTIDSIPQMEPEYWKDGLAKLDCIVSVVDALRLRDEFQGGINLLHREVEEADIENLVIQQIEFCNIILLNKASEVSPEELGRVRQVLHTIQPKAKIIECDYADIDLDAIVGTGMFDFEEVATSAAWVQGVEGEVHEEEEEHHHHHHHHHDDEEDVCPECGHHHHEGEECHHEHHHHDHHDDEDDDEVCPECGHHHHHHDGCCCGHHHGEGHSHGEEYGISTFVYYARKPMNIGLFDHFVARNWPKSVIRAKGICYFHDERNICYVFEQAGKQVSMRQAGQWYATMPEGELQRLLATNEQVRRDWDETYGDRMQKIVFIGQHMDKEAIKTELDKCLVD